MSELTYRAVSPDEFEQFARINQEAFAVDLARSRAWLEEEHGGELRAIYEGGRIVAQMLLLPMRVAAGGAELGCGGIAAVSSPPHTRRRGYTDRLLRAVCEELRERGMPLSQLAPFRATFYRRFGWATHEERRYYRGPIEALARFRRERRGRWEPAGAEQIPELDAVYRGALRGRFGPVLRDERWWRRETLRLHRDERFAFLWRDDAGTPRTYCIYGWEGHRGRRTMTCHECVALDPEARAQLFGFMADHDAQAADVSFQAPIDAPVNAVLPEPFASDVEPGMMLRLVDVPAALGAWAVPGDVAGRLTLAVADDWLEHNRGVYELEIGGGSIVCRRLPDEREAEIACEVTVLAQIYARYLRPRSAAAFGLLAVRHRPALALLDRAFAGLAPICLDSF